MADIEKTIIAVMSIDDDSDDDDLATGMFVATTMAEVALR